MSTPKDSEVEELRAEIARLRAQVDAAPATVPLPVEPPARTGWWRPVVATVLVIVIAILTPLGVLARWAHNEISDTDQYVETVGPLASNPAVQEAVSERVTEEITTRLKIEAVTKEAIDALSERGLPPLAAQSLRALSDPLATSIEDFIHDEVLKLVESSQFQEAWIAANREAHTQLVAVLTGKGSDLVQVKNNAVTLNLTPVIEAVKQRLVARGFTLASQLPTVNAQFTIFESADITRAQNAFRLLSALNTLLPIIVLVLLAVAVGVARNRRTTLIAAMIAVAVSMLLLGVALNAFRMVYLDAISADDLPVDAAAVVYDTLVWDIRLNLRALLVLTLAVAFIAWVFGPSPAAGTVRRATSKVIGGARSEGERLGLNTGRFGIFLGTYKTVIRWAVLGLALVVYAMADHPTGGFTLWLVAITALVLLVVELLSRSPDADSSPGAEEAAPPPPPPTPPPVP